MHVLLLTQWFDPEPVFKALPFARALAGLGHRVEVLTGFPNYPTGRLYPGYRIRPYQVETFDGIRVHRVALYPSHDGSAAKRALNYGSFAASASIAALGIRRPDVTYVYHPPGTVAVAAMVMSTLRNVPFVLDIQDLWPDSMAATGMVSSKVALKAVDWLSRRVYRRATRIVVLSPGFKTALIRRGVPPQKIEVIPNWCDERHVRTLSATPDEKTDGFEVLYAGSMGPAQALAHVLDAAAIVSSRCPQVRFSFVGTGIDAARLAAYAAERGLSNVRFLPQQPLEAVSSLFASAGALLVHLKPDALFRITIPSKTQAYMAAGRPIVMAVEGDAADMVREADCGVTCAPGNAESIAKAVMFLASLPAERRRELGANGARFYRERLSMAVGVRRFEAVFRQACASPSGALPNVQGLG